MATTEDHDTVHGAEGGTMCPMWGDAGESDAHGRLHARLHGLDPVLVDRIAAVVLTVLAWLQIAGFRSLPYAAETLKASPLTHANVWTYVVASACLLPIAFRRQRPFAVFVVSAAAMAVYSYQPWPPTIVGAGVMFATFTLATRYGGRRTVPLVVLVAGLSLGVSLLTVSSSRLVAQAVGGFALLAAVAFMGGAVRSQRAMLAAARRAEREEARRRLDEERLRIAREIHDIMAHSLTLMTVQADAGAAAFDARPERARESLAIVGDTGRAALRDLRSILDVLTNPEDQSPRTPLPDMSGIAALVDSVREAGFATSLELTGDMEAVPTVVGVSAYRIVQESLTNAVRHSGARSVAVRIDAAPDALSVEVVDDGSADPSRRPVEGRGVRGMRERIAALGGVLDAGPRGAHGFRVFARIPHPKGI